MINRIAIYYGYPALVNNSLSIQQAVDTFKLYDLLVLGKDLEKNSHPDHANTELIINHNDMANTKIFGYIDTTYSTNAMKNSVDKWFNMNIDGIFINLFGFDFGTTREQQNTFVGYIHGKGLTVFINSWDPDDALSNIVQPNHKLLSTDWYLAESFGVKNNEYVTDWIKKGEKLLNYKNDIQIAGMSSTNSDGTATTLTFSQNKADYSYFLSIMHEFKAWGFGENYYSAIDNLLPYRSRKYLPEFDYFKTNITNNGNIYERQMNIGIHIDTLNHTISYKLN